MDNEDAFPPIKVVVVEGSEDITIKISDEGGGIPRSAIPLIWTSVDGFFRDSALFPPSPLRLDRPAPEPSCQNKSDRGFHITHAPITHASSLFGQSAFNHSYSAIQVAASASTLRSSQATAKNQNQGQGQELNPGYRRYLYTTMSDEGLEANIESSDFKAPMAGFG